MAGPDDAGVFVRGSVGGWMPGSSKDGEGGRWLIFESDGGS